MKLSHFNEKVGWIQPNVLPIYVFYVLPIYVFW